METSSRSRERGRPAVKDLLQMHLKKDNVKVKSELLPVSVASYNEQIRTISKSHIRDYKYQYH